MKSKHVEILGTGSFLPGDPVPCDRVEDVLGRITQAPGNIIKFVDNVGPDVLAKNGVEKRHFAVDPETHNMTHTFSSLAEEAARSALRMAELDPSDIDLVIMACPSYDMSTPPTSTLLQDRLGIETCAEMEIHSNCAGTGKAVQVAFDALRTGRYRKALVCYSQLSSLYLRACYFNQASMGKVNAALRWILADGAGALILGASEEPNGRPEILDTFVESVGGTQQPGMVAGGAAADLTNADYQIPELYAAGKHHLWQDFSAVNNKAAPLLLAGLVRFTAKMQMDSATVNHYIVSIPTLKLYSEHIPKFLEQLRITEERIQFRCGRIGYVGGAATLIHLDQMARAGEIKRGQTVIVHAVESSKWMSAGFAARW